MRKHVLMAAAALATLLAFFSITAAAAAPAAAHHVLTIRKVGGKQVKVGAILKASLKTGTKATFFTSGTNGVSCKSSTFTDKVVKNPAKPGTAVESLKSQKFSHCTVAGISGATGVKSVTLLKLPYKTTISDAAGDPVTVFKGKTKITLSTIAGTLTCSYSTAKAHGNASNGTQLITFSMQTFKLSSGPPHLCPSTGTFSATFGPVRDMSVAGHPHVFVN